MFRIAIVDDESYVRMGLKTIAEKEGKYTVVGEADNGASAVQMIMQKQPDAVFLDITIPGLDGMEVLKEIRQRGYSGHVTMLTCHDEFRLVQQALRLGADDYLTKPFGINELMARVNSLIRRYTTLNPVAGSEAATMLLKDMVIDKVNRTVTLQNLPVELTGKEFDLLVFLASNKGRVFTKKQIYTQVWAEEYAFDDSNIMSFISKLRKKIEPNPEQPFYIQTVRGVGYRFNKEV